MIAASEPITYFQAIVLGLLQGVTELFPISSLGHSVIFPSLFGWNIHQNDKYFLTFLIATHLAACATERSPRTISMPSSAGCSSSAPSPLESSG